MARHLERGRNPDTAAADDKQGRTVVETILANVQDRGDAAVRELSARFDGLDRAGFRLTDQEIRDCLAEMPARAVEDIKFAQTQMRHFAQHQCKSLRDIEVETLPGIVMGRKNVPVNSVGCYAPGGKYPLLASAHTSVVTGGFAGMPVAHPGRAAGTEGGDRGHARHTVAIRRAGEQCRHQLAKTIHRASKGRLRHGDEAECPGRLLRRAGRGALPDRGGPTRVRHQPVFADGSCLQGQRTVCCVSKSAVEGLTEAMALDLAPHSVRGGMVCPLSSRRR